MDKSTLTKLEKHTCKILEEFADKGYHSPSDIATVKSLLSSMVKIKAIEAMDKYENNQSGRQPYFYDDDGSYRRRRYYYDDGGSGEYDNHSGEYDGSYRRRRYYDNEGGLKKKLESMMNETSNEHERRIMQEMLQKM